MTPPCAPLPTGAPMPTGTPAADPSREAAFARSMARTPR